jgi:hypothetical protein
MTYKKFYGSTWIGPCKKNLKQNDELNYDESVFFSTPIYDEHIYIVVEIVYQSKTTGRVQSCGWSAFRPFSTEDGSQQFQRFLF